MAQGVRGGEWRLGWPRTPGWGGRGRQRTDVRRKKIERDTDTWGPPAQ